MINDQPLSRFEAFGSGLLKPIYADYSFGNIANTIHYLLTRERLGPLLPEDCFGGSYPKPSKVVLFVIDAFGWRSWKRYIDRFAVMRRIADNGVLTPISALFPSTTSASITSLNLGVLPAQHALYEWTVYIPAYGEVVQPLPFTVLGSHVPELCAQKGYDPAALVATHETMHERLAGHGVRSIQFSHQKHAVSSYNRIVCKGAELIRHNTLAEAMLQLRSTLESLQDEAYLNFYWASIDSIAHQYGPLSAYHEAESAAFWHTFDALLGGLNTPDTLFLLTADHDQVSGKREETIYINERLADLADILPISPAGKPIYPNGSPRDLFLHIRPERYGNTLYRLREEFGAIAEIISVDDAIAQGLFGPSPVAGELRERLGDILVLPYDGYFIGWREAGLIENRFNGHHGGLAASELISALAVTDRL
jgi:hypothetical protein